MLEHLTEYSRTVGHHAVDAEVEQAVHLVGVVDGPHVHVDAEFVGPVDEPTVDDQEWPLADRHLSSVRRERSAEAERECCDAEWTECGAHVVAEESPDPEQAQILFRRQDFARVFIGIRRDDHLGEDFGDGGGGVAGSNNIRRAGAERRAEGRIPPCD